MTALLVALAGGLGALARFLVDTEVGRRTPRLGVPLGTMVVNVTGSLLLGWITGWWAFHTGDAGLKLILGTGFMGGYTTFSTASVEAARMARGGLNLRSAVHASVVLVLSVTAAGLGTWLGSL